MEEMRQEISVIIPMYNSEKTIQAALDSINQQTALDLIREIVIVNDGSTDKSKSIVEQYKQISKIPIILINQKNCGVSAARNTGMKVASGKWIALLDADDYWFEYKIEKQANILKQNPYIDFLGANMNEKEMRILWKRINSLYHVSVKDLCIKMLPQTSLAIFRRRIFKEIGGYDEKQKYAEDGNYFLKICANYNYYHDPIQLILYGNGKRGFGVSGLSANLKQMYLGNLKNIREMKELGYISFVFYLEMRAFYWIKYLRRVFITLFSSLSKGKQK